MRINRTGWKYTLAFLGVVGCLVQSAIAGDWPQWRGPLGTGISDERRVPVAWTATKNVKWKVPLPAEGNSSPIVVAGKVLVTCPNKQANERSLLCLDRTDGKELWRQTVTYNEPEATHGTNPQASASPVSDGERVIVWYGSAGLFCYDLDGKEQWKKDLGKFDHIWGYGTSPVLVGELVILNAGPGTSAFVVALNKKTGEEVWRHSYDGMKADKPDQFKGSWSTPVVIGEGEQSLLLLSLPNKLRAVKPNSGEEVWSCGGMSDLVYTSPVITGEAVVTMCGYHGPALAVRLGGMGDVTATHRLWRHETKNPQRIGSGVAVDGHVYILNENGVAWCLDALTGEKKWEQRIGEGTSWGSMCHVDGRLYVQNMKGNVIVLKADPNECSVISHNELNEGSRSSPAFSNGNVFIRTFKNLYCIEDPTATALLN